MTSRRFSTLPLPLLHPRRTVVTEMMTVIETTDPTAAIETVIAMDPVIAIANDEITAGTIDVIVMPSKKI